MQIVKGKKIIEDNWRYIADGDEPSPGDITVSLTRWQQEKRQLLNRDGKIGVRISPDDSLSDLTDDLATFSWSNCIFRSLPTDAFFLRLGCSEAATVIKVKSGPSATTCRIRFSICPESESMPLPRRNPNS